MIKRRQSNGRLSHIVEYPLAGSVVVISGQVAENRDLDITGQTKDVLSLVERLLAEAGTSKERLISAQIWLPDINDFDAMNAVWDGWVSKDNPPARACVESRLADPRLKIEVQVWALK
ncbi:RidA family protein [Ochrobactrum sp. CM-21-5]|nr:RidA family protein [Ochrobactrum sp. CM-21-5]MBC2887650.1 RidA family protein [Ochrobactrum sp. CM-21-5]